MYNYIRGSLPPLFSNYIQSITDIHNYPTHFATTNTFRPFRCNKFVTQRSIRYRAPSHWNQLPLDLKNLSKFKFKKEYKNHVFSIRSSFLPKFDVSPAFYWIDGLTHGLNSRKHSLTLFLLVSIFFSVATPFVLRFSLVIIQILIMFYAFSKSSVKNTIPLTI